MRIIALVLIIVLLVTVTPGLLIADRGAGSIQLSANPSSIAADGKSFTTITAEVRDLDGKPAPDGTEIRFTASLGEVEETGIVQTGTARVKLTSSNLPGASTVTATWIDGQAVSRMNVVFGSVVTINGPEYIDVTASDYLAYSVDHRVLEAIGNVKLRYRTIELEAESVQVDLDKFRITAKGEGRTKPVRLISKTGVTEASMFTCDLSGSQGLMLSAERGKVQKVGISGAGWELGADQAFYMPQDFDFTDISDSGVLVKANQATIFPNEKIQFHRTNVYVNGKRMLTLPLYVLSLTGYQENGEQYVGYSTGGITLNLPFYYSLSPRSTGAMLVRHGLPTGWGQYSQTPGWFIDLRQKYKTNTSEGMLTLNQITNDWGAQLSHSQRFAGNTNAYVFLDYPLHKSLYGVLNLSKSFSSFDIGINTSGTSGSSTQILTDGATGLETDRYTTRTRRTSGDIYAQTRSKRLAKMPLSYTFAARAEQNSTDTNTVYQSGSHSEEASRLSTQRLDGNLYTNPITLKKNVSLRGSGSLGYVFGDPNQSGLSTLGNGILDWKISSNNNLQLGYRYASRPMYRYENINPPGVPADYRRVRDRNGSQSLSASLRVGDGKKWWGNVYAIQGLNYGSTNVFSDFNYRLSSDWRFSARSTMNRFEYPEREVIPNGDGTFTTMTRTKVQSYSDLELALGKKFGNREILAVWSQREGKIMLELGSGGF